MKQMSEPVANRGKPRARPIRTVTWEIELDNGWTRVGKEVQRSLAHMHTEQEVEYHYQACGHNYRITLDRQMEQTNLATMKRYRLRRVPVTSAPSRLDMRQ